MNRGTGRGAGRYVAALAAMAVSISGIAAINPVGGPAGPTAAAAITPPPAVYNLTDLGALGGLFGYAINDDGIVVGAKPNGNGFRYDSHDATMQDLGPGAPTAVSDNGTVFGIGRGTSTGGNAIGVTPDGKTASGASFEPGIIPPGYGSGTNMPGIWSSTDGWRSLYQAGCQLPNLTSGAGYAINQSGTLVGQMVSAPNHDPVLGVSGMAFACTPDPANPAHYFVENLAPFSGPNTGAFAIERHGTIAGKVQPLNGPIEANVWTDENGTRTSMPLGTYAQGHEPTNGFSQSGAYGINDAGTVVGSYGDVATNPMLMIGSAHNRAFVRKATNGVMKDLTDLLPADSGWTLNNAFDINNVGQIVGQGTLNGQLRAYLLTPGGNVNLTPLSIMVNQVVQNADNQDLLIADKTTYAIVHAQSDTQDVPEVHAVLRGTRDGADLGTLQPVNPPATVKTDAGPWDSPASTFLFKLPADWVGIGDLNLIASINDDNHVTETDYTDNDAARTVTFLPGDPVKIVVVDAYYPGLQTPTVDFAAFERLRSLVTTLLPSAEVDISHELSPIALATPKTWVNASSDQCAAVVQQLAQVHDDMGLDAKTLLYAQMGFRADGRGPYESVDASGTVHGDSAGCSYVPDLVATGWTGYAGPNPLLQHMSSERVAAHELIHAIGRNHVEECGAKGHDSPDYPAPAGAGHGYVSSGSVHSSELVDVSFDTASGTFLPYNSVLDIMTYCTDQWMSDYTYENVARLLPDIGGLTRNSLSTYRAAVVGAIDPLSASASISATESPVSSALPASVPGPYHIELYNGSTKLSDTAFTPAQMGPHDTTGGETPRALVDETVDLIPGADRIAIYSDEAGKEIASISIHGAAPAVHVTGPNNGDVLPASGQVPVSWSANDPDNDPLTFTVKYRPTPTSPWTILDNEATGSSTTIDAAALAGSTNGTVRVVGNDGFHTAFDDVTGLVVPDKAPRVTIDQPLDDATVTTEQSVALSGTADVVGATLPDSAFQWSSDLDGVLGTGRAVVAQTLSIGTHHIRLRVTGPGGRVASATVTLTVGAPGTTPSQLAVSQNALMFTRTTAAPGAQDVVVYDPSGGSLGWNASSDDPRVTLSSPSGTTPTTLHISADTTGLHGGEAFAAHVTVTPTSGSQAPIVIDVGAQSGLGNGTIAPIALDFGRQAVGSSAAPKTVTFTYNGAGSITLGAASIAGASPGEYAASADHCSNATLSSGQSCTVAVTFAPTGPGRTAAYLVLADSDSEARWFVSLTGVSSYTVTSSVVAWGTNEYGQLGATTGTCQPDPTNAYTLPCSNVPVTVAGLSDVVQVAPGGKHSLALKSDGTVWAWGSNDQGELGDGTKTPPIFGIVAHPVPQRVPGLTNVIAVAAAQKSSLALKSDGTVWAWGLLGIFNNGFGNPTPTQVRGIGGVGFLTNVVAIATGTDPSGNPPNGFALRADGTVVAWGENGSGQLGNGNTFTSTNPTQVVGPGGQGFLSGVVAVDYDMALKNDGTLWAWGPVPMLGVYNYPTITGYTNQTSPLQVTTANGGAPPLTGITAISADEGERFALDASGQVWAWGYGPTASCCSNALELGVGSGPTPWARPVLGPGGLGTLTGVTKMGAGSAVTSDGAVWGWGNNDFGQVGIGTLTTPTAPQRVLGIGGTGFLADVQSLAGGVDHRLAIIGGGGGGPSTTLSAEPPGAVASTVGTSFTKPVGSFDDSAASHAFDFSATVDWGDGSSDFATTLSGPDGGPYVVNGTHTYAHVGSFPLSIDVVARNGDAVNLTGTATVTKTPLSARPAVDVTFTAGEADHRSLGAFDDPNSFSVPGDFTATVDWGDGSAVAAATVSGPPGGPFSIDATHAYRRAATYPLTLHAVDTDGAQVTVLNRAVVLPASLFPEGTYGSDGASGNSFAGPIARFTDGNGLALASDYRAVVDWGDGSASVGSVSGPTGGPWTVAGAHTYASSQPFTARVTINGPAGASATATTTVLSRIQKITLAASVTPASGTVTLDSVFSYVVRNTGTDALFDVHADGDICGAGIYASGDNGNGALDPGESWTFTCNHSFPTIGTFTDVSAASGLSLATGIPVRSTNVGTDVDVLSTVPLVPTLTIAKTATATVAPGAAITYGLTYENVGAADAENVVITDTLPAGIAYNAALDTGAGPKPASVTANSDGTTTLRWNIGTVVASSGPKSIGFRARPSLLSLTASQLTNTVAVDYTAIDGTTFPRQTASATTTISAGAITANPLGQGYWQTHPAEWTTEVLARVQATDGRYDGTDGSRRNGALTAGEVTAVFKALGQPATLRSQLLVVYFNLATRRIGAGTMLKGTLAASLGVTKVGGAAAYATTTLALPYTGLNKTRYSNATTLLDDINQNRSENY